MYSIIYVLSVSFHFWQALQNLIMNGDEEACLYLHRNIRILNEQGTPIAFFTEDVLKPKANAIFMVEDVDELTFMVSLQKPPRAPAIIKVPQPLDNEESLEKPFLLRGLSNQPGRVHLGIKIGHRRVP